MFFLFFFLYFFSNFSWRDRWEMACLQVFSLDFFHFFSNLWHIMTHFSRLFHWFFLQFLSCHHCFWSTFSVFLASKNFLEKILKNCDSDFLITEWSNIFSTPGKFGKKFFEAWKKFLDSGTTEIQNSKTSNFLKSPDMDITTYQFKWEFEFLRWNSPGLQNSRISKFEKLSLKLNFPLFETSGGTPGPMNSKFRIQNQPSEFQNPRSPDTSEFSLKPNFPYFETPGGTPGPLIFKFRISLQKFHSLQTQPSSHKIVAKFLPPLLRRRR